MWRNDLLICKQSHVILKVFMLYLRNNTNLRLRLLYNKFSL